MPTMESCDSQTVRVAVNIRPLVTPELLLGCTDCITVYPAEKQVQIGSHSFTFDSVFGSKGHPSSGIFDECVAPLVDALFHGYNSTVLAYGQTGSGKTYTMGTNYNGEGQSIGVIPRVIDTIFSTVETMKESAEFLIRISFIEIFKEEVFDLLDSHASTQLKNDASLMVKTTGLSRAPIQIRETVSGGITLAGVTEAEVRTKEEMASYILQGSLSRATASTNMNSQSSRSHAILTISVEQRRLTHLSSGDDVADDILMAKLHLVDLAGSERAKRTGADGTRLQEGIHINKGLLSLGNVISALGDDKKRKEGGHIPYRDSKLTRILQDSLGGNSKTVMIACVSPADTNAEETLNTLKYANRARNIQNKAIINRDPVAAQMQRMRGQIEQLQAELLYFRGDSSAPTEEIQILKQKISLLEESKKELQEKLHECRTGFEHLSQRAIDAQVERDRLLMKVESAQNGKQLEASDAKSDEDYDMVKSYIAKIQDLEVELVQLKNSNCVTRDDYANYLALEDDGILSRTTSLMDSEMNAVEKDDEVVDVEKELEHCSLQEQLDRELKELDEKLLLKEAEMKQFSGPDTSVLKQHYEKKVQDLELEKSALQKEIEALRQNLASMSTHSGDSAQKVKEEYLQKLNLLEKQVAELKKKQDGQAQLLRQKQKSDEAAKRLHDEILRIKTQKVQLHQKIKQESEQFRMWKASREKEVLQLKKEGRRNEYEMHKLLSLNQRQKLVLQRKSEEAAAATKRLKEVLDSRKASREMHGAGSKNGPGIQALVQSIEHELEVTVRVHEVRIEYERQKEERAKIAQEIAKLKEEALGERHSLSEFQQTMSPGARSSRIYALENMLSTSSSTLISMASHLSEAEERERVFSGRGRWNQVRALGEAKNIMNFLFNLASSSRCQLRDSEVDCREKDSEIRDLKGKVVHLIRQLDLQKAELYHQENLIKSLKKQAKEMKEGHVYDLRPLGHRNSIMVNSRVGFELQEEMDTSEDKDSDWVQPDEENDLENKKEKKRRNPKKRNSKGDNNIEIIEISPDSTSRSVAEGVCCSCSSKSQCKTTKCECRAKGGSCSFSCTCEAMRCSNRPEDYEKNMLKPEFSETVGDIVKKDEVMRNEDLASHGARLLQNALSEKPISSNEDGISRRPLSDIGNNLPKPSAPNTAPRKKWRKSVIPALKVIPAPTSHEVEIAELARLSEGNNNSEIDIPLKLPRVMRSSLPPINNQLKDKNSNPTNEPLDKESSSLGSLEQQAKPKNGKENMKL